MANLRIYTVLGLSVLFSSAEAHCYSIWKYPYPQKCGAVRRPVEHATMVVLPPDPLTEEEQRERAIEQLKEEMNHVGY